MEDVKIRTIGGCSGCRKSAVLVEGACGACVDKFGPRFASLASKIRESEPFKRKCYDALKTDEARTKFIAMFGTVGQTHVMGSTGICQGSR